MAEVFWVFLKLGLTSFGGPVAHLGYFRDEFVTRRKWLDEKSYADLVALCQFLPGPASSQVGLCVGISRAGLPGAAAAWLAFTAPSALALLLFAYGVGSFGGAMDAGWLHGLKIAAVAVVGQAVWGMARSLCPDRERATLAAAAAIAVLSWPGVWGQVGVIAAGAVFGRLWVAVDAGETSSPLHVPIGRGLALGAWAVFFILLVSLPVLAELLNNPVLTLVDSFYRSGSLVFGGGHVVMPLLQAEVVPPGWVGKDAFLAGYGAVQAVPGPLFTFAAYLGSLAAIGPGGWLGGLVALLAIFLPSFLLVVGTLPFWNMLRRRPGVQSALAGVNAAVVGLLLAAFYDPVWTSAIGTAADFALAVAAFGLLVFWKTPPWLVVVLAALGGQGLALAGL